MYGYTLCRRTTKFDAVTHMGRGPVSATVPSQTGGAAALPNFGGFLSMTTFSKEKRPNWAW